MITEYFTPDFLQKLKTCTSLNNPVKKTKTRLLEHLSILGGFKHITYSLNRDSVWKY
jgi:hypothetical protein